MMNPSKSLGATRLEIETVAEANRDYLEIDAEGSER
jgi:hypothetical protein